MHNSPINNKDNKTILTEGLAQILITSKYDIELAVFCFRYFIEGTEEKVSGPALIKFTDALNDLITPEKAEKTIELLWELRNICIHDSKLKNFAINLYKSYIELKATTDAYNYYLAGNSKPFVDRVAPQHASTSEHQSHVERYVDPAIVKAKAESMESDIESSQSSLRRRHVSENIKSEGASSQTFVEKYADHKKDKPEKGCLETVRAMTGGYCSIQ